ncbi:hypothetical protein JIN80_17830 [Cerasicoccus arenae]|nr:hypothetical protein [Cerasicoccus arenae]
MMIAWAVNRGILAQQQIASAPATRDKVALPVAVTLASPHDGRALLNAHAVWKLAAAGFVLVAIAAFAVDAQVQVKPPATVAGSPGERVDARA